MSICIMGADPGASGAICFYFPGHPDAPLAVFDTPTVNDKVDAATLRERINQFKPDLAIVELVGAMPKQGVSSTFKFGVAFGTLCGVVSALGIETHFVTPGKWKKHFLLSSEKEASRERALRLWPTCPHFSRKKDHGRAEAALLARYGWETIVPRRDAAE
jgi:hypothetical protein